jgi:hypothetical protein
MKWVAAVCITARDASQIDGMPMSLESSQLRITLSGKTVDTLPRCTGIYRFLDGQDQLLCIGKSVNIHIRVRSQFTTGLFHAQRRTLFIQ